MSYLAPDFVAAVKAATGGAGVDVYDSMPSFVVQSSHASWTAALKVRSMLTRRRAGWTCDAKLGAAPVRLLERGEIQLAHLQQGFHDFCGVSRFRVAHHLPEGRRDNLP